MAEHLERRGRTRSDDLLHLAVAGLPEHAFMILDAEGVITFWNVGAEHLFGWSSEQAMRVRVSALLGPGGREAGIGASELENAKLRGSVTATRPVKHHDGSTQVVRTTILALRNATGVLGYSVAAHLAPVGPGRAELRIVQNSVEDTSLSEARRQLSESQALPAAEMTDRKQAEASDADIRHESEFASAARAEPTEASGAALTSMRMRLQELQRAVTARDEFIATVAHELRNPIAPLTFQVRLALNKAEQLAAAGTPLSAEWVQTQLRGVEQRLHRLLETLDRLLDVSRISTGRIDLQPNPMNLAEVVREVVDGFDAVLAVARCKLTLVTRGNATGSWDRLRVEQVLRNLLSNAIRFGAGHPIEVTVDADQDFASVTVRDHGIGIAPEQQAKIFERFERGAEQRSGGFGVGLWIVRSICVAMGGTVSVESQVGEGACFTVMLPRGPTRPAVESAAGD